MSDRERDEAERATGPLLGPNLLAAVPLRTLGDDYRDVPDEPADDRVPAPEPPGFMRRIVERLARKATRTR